MSGPVARPTPGPRPCAASRVLQSAVMLGIALFAAACGRALGAPILDDWMIAPSAPAPTTPFPDSVTAGRGLPPRGTSASARSLGGDTLVVALVTVTPRYSLESTGGALGHPAGEPTRIGVRVFARDTSVGALEARPLALAACPITLRLFESADRAGAPVWRSDASPAPLACPIAIDHGPDDHTFEWPVAAILGDSLPAGPYWFAHAVRLADGRSLEYATGGDYLSATRTPSTRDRSALRMTARSAVLGQAPRMLETTVVVTNTGARAVEVMYGACMIKLRLYRGRARVGAPVWRSEFRHPATVDGEPVFYGCPAIGIGSIISPGDSLLFPTTIPLAEVLADSVPAGVYAVSADFAMRNDDLPVDGRGRDAELDAGVVELPSAPDPLPSSRVVHGLTYTATTRLIAGAVPGTDTLRTLVLVRNDGAARVDAGVPHDCPLVVFAYRSAAVRDSFPLQLPAWGSPGCALVPHQFALDPGESWVFAHDVLAADVVAAAGPSRYWFTAWVPGWPDVRLAAGDMELGR